MALDGGKIVSYLELDTSGYESSLQSVMRQLKDAGNQSLTASKRLSSLGGALGTAGSALTRGVTVPLLAAGTAAATAAISFESAFAGVRKTVNATEAEYASLAQGLKDMSGEIPASANELAGLMEIAGQLGVDYGRITVRCQTSRWGSCSAKGNLNFNWKLIMAPPQVLDYVVIHELCHLIEFNHSPRFWGLVCAQMPEYLDWKKWLDRHGSELGVE